MFSPSRVFFSVPKDYGSSTRITRLKVAPNMAHPISLKG